MDNNYLKQITQNPPKIKNPTQTDPDNQLVRTFLRSFFSQETLDDRIKDLNIKQEYRDSIITSHLSERKLSKKRKLRIGKSLEKLF